MRSNIYKASHLIRQFNNPRSQTSSFNPTFDKAVGLGNSIITGVKRLNEVQHLKALHLIR